MIIISCINLKNELDKKKAREEAYKILLVKLEESKIYTINTNRQLKIIYKEVAERISNEEFKIYVEEHQRLNYPKEKFVYYFKKL